jgi:hypothetical protein
MENKKMMVRKIHIRSLIEALDEVYNMGIDFVDLFGETEADGVDSITLRFKSDYTEENEMFNEDDSDSKPQTNDKIKLSDDDINQLM